MKKTKYLGIAMLAAGMLAATSCSDFSDYNEAPVDNVASGNQTLWENIAQNSQLTDFASLLQRVGFDAELANSRSYTVWAPLNGTFDAAYFNSLSDEDLLHQFVKSHVAEYSHNATGVLAERVHALNEKSFDFTGSGSYTYDGIAIQTPNLPSNNGVMHLMNGAAQFYPSLYEYLRMGADIDSLSAYLLNYELTTLDENASVKGPMVDGVQTYIDSVMVTSNLMTRTIGAKMENEDSSYTFIMPTNEAYKKQYARIKPTFRYIETTTVLDAANLASASATTSKKVTIDALYMSDSLTRRAIVDNLAFSNNDAYNKWVEGDGAYTDTLRSTRRTKLSNPQDILGQTKEKVKMSNGYARLVDSLAYHPWETYCPQISARINRNIASYFTSSLHNINVTDPTASVFGPEEGMTEFSYLWIEPNSIYSKPDVYVALPDVQSTTYNFYAVFLPSAWLANDTLPNKLNFSLSYCAANGNLSTYNFSAKEGDNNPKTLNMNTAFENNPYKLDSIFIGQFTFPVCYYGLGDYYPSIHITSPISVFNKTHMESYSRDIRMWAIVMKPVEQDEYEAKNK